MSKVDVNSATSEHRPVPVLPAIAAGILLTLAPFSASASETKGMTADELLKAMQSGGNVIFIRHASTEKDYADQIDAVMGDCSTQRTLSENGWNEAKAIGAAFERLDIPVGEVISSQYCRGWQTADLAFGRYEMTADLNFEPAEEYNEAQTAAMRDRVTPHLAKMPEAGSNTVLVGHDDPFEAATGIYPEPMGVTFVIKPMGEGKFEVLGHIAPNDWAQLR